MVVSLEEEILVAGNVVADCVVSLPPAEKRKAGMQIKFYGIVHHLDMGLAEALNHGHSRDTPKEATFHEYLLP